LAIKYLLLLPSIVLATVIFVHWNLTWKAPAAQFGARQ